MTVIKTVTDLVRHVVRHFPLRRVLYYSHPLARHKKHYMNATQRRSTYNRRRMILIDGTDVATAYSPTQFNVSHLENVLNTLSARNECYAFVPHFRLKHGYSTNNGRLQQLQREKRIIVTPGKSLDGVIVSSDPNPFMLDVAKEFDAAVVSNARYTEERKLNKEFDTLLADRQVAYEWTEEGINFHHATDVNKSLEEVLRH